MTHGMNHVVHLCEWLTLSHVSKEGKIMEKKNKENKEILEKYLRIRANKIKEFGETSKIRYP